MEGVVDAGAVVTLAEAARLDRALDDQVAVDAGRLGRTRFAVRSSAAAEDLPDASYAGQYETALDVPVDRLGAAVRECFTAADSPRVAAYQHHRGGGAAAMAVLVQVMVDAACAGVTFTAHPTSCLSPAPQEAPDCAGPAQSQTAASRSQRCRWPSLRAQLSGCSAA